MTEGCNCILRYCNDVTNYTLLTFGKTGSGTSRCNSRKYFLVVTFSFDKIYAAHGTDLRGGTGCLGSGGMSEGSNCCLSNSSLTTLGTLLTFGKTSFGTGCCLAGNGDFGVSFSFFKLYAAHGTGLRGGTGFCRARNMSNCASKFASFYITVCITII